jgi:hypothetical protein
MMKRYLPIWTQEGGWINRVDLYLLARMGYEDDVGDDVVDRLHDFMSRSKNDAPALNELERDVEKRHVRRQLRLRHFAGQTLLGLVRIAATTGQSPSEGQAIRLCAVNQKLIDMRRTKTESLEREIRRGFSMYRNTAHLQAAMIVADPSVCDMENSEEHTRNFLARARGLEIFVDANVAGKDFKWNPWRIPPVIAANFNISVEALSDEERKASGVT